MCDSMQGRTDGGIARTRMGGMQGVGLEEGPAETEVRTGGMQGRIQRGARRTGGMQGREAWGGRKAYRDRRHAGTERGEDGRHAGTGARGEDGRHAGTGEGRGQVCRCPSSRSKSFGNT